MDESSASTSLAIRDEATRVISALPCSDRMKRALALVAEGRPYREAAAEVGYKDHRDVYRWAKKAGLTEVHSDRLVAGYRRLAALSNAELERRLVECPEEIGTKDLAVVSGIAADKAARYENWGRGDREDGGGFSDAMARTLDRIAASGGVSIEIKPASRDHDVIDVTPTKPGES